MKELGRLAERGELVPLFWVVMFGWVRGWASDEFKLLASADDAAFFLLSVWSLRIARFQLTAANNTIPQNLAAP